VASRRILAGGAPNPNYHARSGSRIGDRTLLPDGTRNPTYRDRSGHAKRDHKHAPDGSPNPDYRPRTGRLSKFMRGLFIAWDGEGITVDTRRETVSYQGQDHEVQQDTQAYVLLANSEGARLVDPNGIGTIAAFEFLLDEAARNPHAIHALYGAQYDHEMMLKDLSRWHLEKLNAGEWVRWQGYKIQYRPRRSLFICRVDRHPGEVGSIVLFDVIGFFQGGFVSALEDWCRDHPDLELIKHGKDRRGEFTLRDMEFMQRYNDAELAALVDLMRRFHQAAKDTGYVLRRWDGAGALAAAMMQKHGVHDHMARRTVTTTDPTTGREVAYEAETTPGFVRQAALRAMAGGRIECLQIGHHRDEVWEHDLNSAYPTYLREVPSLNGATWTRHRGAPCNFVRYALYHVSWDLPDGCPIYPFFYRDPHGRISYPPNGEGWYWGPEVIAALDHHPTGIVVHEWISCTPATPDKPFGFVQAEAARRLELKLAGDPSQKPLKLAINALYGKCAQQKGAHTTPDGRLLLPRYYQPEWAGFVTSSCRAAVYETAMHDPHSVIMIATDGVYSTRLLPVYKGDGLGEWEVSRHAWMISVQSGVYFKEDNGQARACYRGFDRASITPDRVLTAWREGEATLSCAVDRFITLGAAHKSSKPTKQIWRTWRRAPRTLRLDGHGTKRTSLTPAQLHQAAGSLVPTRPIPNPFTTECSHPTRVAWNPEDTLDQSDDWEIVDTVPLYVMLRDVCGD
jgi:hypothetical protein